MEDITIGIIALIIALVFMLAPPIVTAVIASKKGHSAVGWFFLGLFLNWIAILIIVLIQKNEPNHQQYYYQPPYGTQNGYQPYRPAPANFNPYEQNHVNKQPSETPSGSDTPNPSEPKKILYTGTCPDCGGFVSDSVCTNCARYVEAPKKISYCRQCGSRIDSPFCPNCGTKRE
ncbi:MAG: hypothetical protein IKC63_02985 [Clostridia bacterium]|nr:hypothetical protein [Clostridia bacterium]